MKTELQQRQMQEWHDLLATHKQARKEMEQQLIQKYGYFSFWAKPEKQNQRELLASWHESDRIGLNAKHLSQFRGLTHSYDDNI